jgi:hypothetical protein
MQGRITREVKIPEGGKLWDVEGVAVIELNDGSPVFAYDLSRAFPSAKFRMFRCRVTEGDLKYWENDDAVRFVFTASPQGNA